MASNIAQLASDIEHAAEKLTTSDTFESAQEKQRLLLATRSLLDKLEGPEVGIWRVIFGSQANAALRSAFKMRIFEEFDPSAKVMNAGLLAEKTGVEKLLLVRIMRALICGGIFKEIGEEEYAHNQRSLILTKPILRTMMGGLGGIFTPYMNKMPEYLESIAFQNPGTGQQNLFQYAMQTEMDFFDWLHTQPKELEVFSAAMAASAAIQQKTIVNLLSESFPPGNLFTSDTDEILVVDVGGGRGEILNELRNVRPDLHGSMIVQDLAKEIESREPGEGIRSMVHDFFTTQPIKGAHTYLFRHIFHDWPDAACRLILQQTVSAMKKGCSRLVILDSVLPNVGASLFGSLLDINMIALSGLERTERHWRELLEQQGLEVTCMLPPPIWEGG